MRNYCIVDKHKELYSILCGDLNVKEIQGRGSIGIRVADLVWCIAETNTILLSNYIPIKKKCETIKKWLLINFTFYVFYSFLQSKIKPIPSLSKKKRKKRKKERKKTRLLSKNED